MKESFASFCDPSRLSVFSVSVCDGRLVSLYKTVPVSGPSVCLSVCRVLYVESSSCVEFVSAAAFSVSRCVRVETMGYDASVPLPFPPPSLL